MYETEVRPLDAAGGAQSPARTFQPFGRDQCERTLWPTLLFIERVRPGPSFGFIDYELN